MTFSHPDSTVGTGISPVQFRDPSHWKGTEVAGCHRRWGIAPRPKDLRGIYSMRNRRVKSSAGAPLQADAVRPSRRAAERALYSYLSATIGSSTAARRAG